MTDIQRRGSGRKSKDREKETTILVTIISHLSWHLCITTMVSHMPSSPLFFFTFRYCYANTIFEKNTMVSIDKMASLICAGEAIRKDPPITADENNRRFENILQLMVNTCDDGSAPLIRENGKPWSTWRLHQHLLLDEKAPGGQGHSAI